MFNFSICDGINEVRNAFKCEGSEQFVRTQNANLFAVTEKTVSRKVGVFFVSAFANGLIFNLEHNPLSFGGFRFSLFKKESKIVSSNSCSLE